MIRHVALFRFSERVPTESIRLILDGFEALDGRVDGLLKIVGGENKSTEQLDHGFAHGIIADFEDLSALEDYLQHPDHIKVADDVFAALRTGPLSDIIAFDMELDSFGSNQPASGLSSS